MLYEFMEKNRDEVLARARETLIEQNGGHDGTEGLPQFFDQLVAILQGRSGNIPEGQADAEMSASATLRGADLQRLGVTVGQLVHAYGVICDVVTRMAMNGRLSIAPEEFHVMNMTLDKAIAIAVSEHGRMEDEASQERARLHLGELAHELRNALSGAALAMGVLKQGRVTMNSSTGQLLERSLLRSVALVDRSLAEVRLDNPASLEMDRLSLVELVQEVEATASFEAQHRNIHIYLQIMPDVELAGDRQLLVSAVSNLVQNAIRYSRPGGAIEILTRSEGDHVLIEVHDECGGLVPGQAEKMFEPFMRGQKAHKEAPSGLGLGLDIAARSVQAHDGNIYVRNNPPKGCIFVIEIPRKLTE